MNIIKRLLGSEPSAESITLSPGELFLHRPESSPRAGRNIIFKESQVTLTSPSESFVSELVVCPIDGDEDGNEDSSDAELRRLESERTFLVDSALKVAYFDTHGQTVVSWVDPEGDAGDRYEFVCAPTISAEALQKFDSRCRTVQYGRKYGRAPPNAKALDEFDFDESITATSVAPPKPQPAQELSGTSLHQVVSDVCLFDGNRKVFVVQQQQVPTHLVETGPFKYALAAGSLAIDITPDMNPVANEEHKAFIFNVELDGKFVTYMVRVSTQEDLYELEQKFAVLLWQSQNKVLWASVSEQDKAYITGALAREEEAEHEQIKQEREEEQDQEDQYEAEAEEGRLDDMEDDEDYGEFTKTREFNSAMEVGHSKDRTYVVRGNNIGVFRTGSNVEYSTTIGNVQDLESNGFTPRNIMLHEQDRALLMQNEADHNKIYRMDLEYGKVVDEWEMYGNVSTYAPLNKFAQSTAESNLVAATDKSVYRVDPRLSGSKVVQDASKTYTKKMHFTAAATTEQGYVAVATKQGAINLYNKLGKVAKTTIPAVGDAILALDVTADGKYLLATFKTYLLLIDTSNAKGSGFTAPFAKEQGEHPVPRRLQITPDNAAFMYSETHKPLSFTPARFNISPDAKESTIVTATGPYVVTWSLDAVLKNHPNPYRIKRYSSTVTADNFKYGSDNSVVVALEDNVGMVSRSSMRRPTRMSLQSDF